jgi:DNA-binding NtrC family response regulator
MRQRHVLVYEADGRLAEALREVVQTHGWRLSEVRHARGCLSLLAQGDGVLVLRVGQDLVRELTLLDQVTWLHPDTAVIVVCDADTTAVAQLACDLEARFVMHPPQFREMLAEVVAGFLAGGGSDGGPGIAEPG